MERTTCTARTTTTDPAHAHPGPYPSTVPLLLICGTGPPLPGRIATSLDLLPPSPPPSAPTCANALELGLTLPADGPGADERADTAAGGRSVVLRRTMPGGGGGKGLRCCCADGAAVDDDEGPRLADSGKRALDVLLTGDEGACGEDGGGPSDAEREGKREPAGDDGCEPVPPGCCCGKKRRCC